MATYSADRIPGSKSGLGEGSLWDERTKTFLWLDVFENRIMQFDPADQSIEEHLMPKVVTYIGKRQSGGFIVALGDCLATLDKDFLPLEFTPLEVDPEAARTNDGNIDSKGNLWIGTADIVENVGAGHLRRIDPKLDSTTFRNQIYISNGIDWSPDGTVMYYIDSATRKISRYRFDSSTGKIIEALPEFDVSDVTGVPDGMCTDSAGNLWVAFWGSGQVRNYSSTGELLNVVHCPSALTTCCSFGGDDLQTLFITSAQTTYDPQYSFGDDADGMCFQVKVSAQGKLDQFFKG
ncbi:MAG: SMP-30/gluconolactonase/LRE family protein [Actinomycetes bacterium]